MAEYDLKRYWSSGEWIDTITAVHTLNATRVVGDIGKLAFSLPYCPRFFESLEKGQQLTLWRNGNQQFRTRYLLQDWRAVTSQNGERMTEVMGYDLNWLLSTRIIAYHASSPQADKTGAVDDMMKAIGRENMGTLATPERRIADLHIEPDETLGKSISKAFAWRNVLRVLQELSDATLNDATKIYFDMHGETVGRTVFSTYADFLGEDRRPSSSNRLLIGEQYGNLRNAKVEWLLSDEATAVYAGGQGQGEERVIKFAEDAKRIELGAPYGRVEIFKDARNHETDDAIQQEAEDALREAKPKIRVTGQLVETEDCRYNRDFRWSDFVTVEAYGVRTDCLIKAVGLSAEKRNERIDVVLEGEVNL